MNILGKKQETFDNAGQAKVVTGPIAEVNLVIIEYGSTPYVGS